MARKFANFFATKLKNDIDAIQTSIALETLPRDKDNNLITEGRIVIEARNSDKREIIKYTGIDVGTTAITGCTRGDGRTIATTHSKGAISEVNVTGEDITDLYDYVDNFINTYPLKNLYDNAIINSGCSVAQRVTAPNLSTTYQFGAVDRFAAKATGTAVSAGTIGQTTTPSVVSIGQALKLANVTITGTGVIFLRYRMEAKDALQFKNLAASFGCLVRQDTGVSVNAKIYINKPTAADNFTSTTNIATSANIPVAHNTNTLIKLENINAGNLGDVSFGLEIEIQLAVGAVTTKNFEFCNFVFNKGALLAPFMPKSFTDELLACKRYYEKSYRYETAPGTSVGEDYTQMSVGEVYPGRPYRQKIVFQVPKAKTPVFVTRSADGTVGRVGYGVAGSSYGVAGTAAFDSNSSAALISPESVFIGSVGNYNPDNIGTSCWTADAEL